MIREGSFNGRQLSCEIRERSCEGRQLSCEIKVRVVREDICMSCEVREGSL